MCYFRGVGHIPDLPYIAGGSCHSPHFHMFYYQSLAVKKVENELDLIITHPAYRNPALSKPCTVSSTAALQPPGPYKD